MKVRPKLYFTLTSKCKAGVPFFSVCVAINKVLISGLSNILFLFFASANSGNYPVSGGQQLFQEWL
jgi:hypothetical protein